MKTKEYNREQLLDVIASYLRMIRRSGKTYPTGTLDDLEKSMLYVLHTNNRSPENGWRSE